MAADKHLIFTEMFIKHHIDNKSMGKTVKKKKNKVIEEGKLDFAINAITQGIDLTKEKWKQIGWGFLKITGLSLIIILITLGILGGVIYFSGIDWITGILIGTPIMIVALLFTSSIGTVTYNVVQDSANNRKTSILNQTMNNIVPLIKFTIFWLLVILVFFAPAIITIIVGGGIGSVYGTLAGMFGGIALYVLGIIGLIIVGFLIQFAAFELYIERAGLRESLKRSYAIIKSNFWETIIFSILIALIAGFISGIIQIPVQILIEILMVFGGGNIVLLILAGILVIVTLLSSIGIEIFALACRYTFWRKAR